MSKVLPAVENIYLDPEVEEELQNRLSRIEGHVRAIKRMLSERASCEELLIQLSAVRSALNQVQDACWKITWRLSSPIVCAPARAKKPCVN